MLDRSALSALISSLRTRLGVCTVYRVSRLASVLFGRLSSTLYAKSSGVE
jgi:hypothetical protein